MGGLVVFFFKALLTERLKNAIKAEYDQKLETHKAQLKAQYRVELERLKADLQIASKEHEIRFVRLHERAAETIAEIYAKLLPFIDGAIDFTRPYETPGGRPRRDRGKIALDAWLDFREYYRPRRIFLPSTTVEQIEAFENKLMRLIGEFGLGVLHESVPKEHADSKWAEIAKIMKEDVPPLIKALEEEFRACLGVMPLQGPTS